MATLYYNNADSDNDWNNLDNWWNDASHTIPASALPTSSDDVVITADVYFNNGSAPTIVNLTAPDAPSTRYVGVTMTVTGVATFGNKVYWSGPGSPTLTGNAIFNGTDFGGITQSGSPVVNGNVTFNDSTVNAGTVTGTVIFNNSSYNSGTISGSATFNDSSYNNDGLISNGATFTAAAFGGTTGIPFNPVGSNVGGTITFSSASAVNFTLGSSDIWGSNASSWVFTTPGQNWTFNDSSRVGASGQITGDTTFNDTSFNEGAVGSSFQFNATFNDNSYNNGFTGNATFNDSSYNDGDVYGNATFSLSSAAVMIANYYSGTYLGSILFKYEKGINGSSILGVI